MRKEFPLLVPLQTHPPRVHCVHRTAETRRLVAFFPPRRATLGVPNDQLFEAITKLRGLLAAASSKRVSDVDAWTADTRWRGGKGKFWTNLRCAKRCRDGAVLVPFVLAAADEVRHSFLGLRLSIVPLTLKASPPCSREAPFRPCAPEGSNESEKELSKRHEPRNRQATFRCFHFLYQ